MTDILEQGRAIADEQYGASGGFRGKKNVYQCERGANFTDAGCGAWICTVDADAGVTPFGIQCGACGGHAHSKCYRVADWLVPTHEWHRPETLEGVDPAYHEHLSRGGLILHPISGNPDIWQDPIPAHPATEAALRAKLTAAMSEAEAEGKNKIASDAMDRALKRALDRKIVDLQSVADTGMKRALADIPTVDKGPWVVAFGDDPHSWNIDEGEGSGLPGESLMRDALDAFARCWGQYDAETAARVFNVPVGLIAPLDAGAWASAPASPVSIDDLSELVQVLSATRTHWGSMSVAEAAQLTNQPASRVIEAVGNSAWMFLFGDYALPDHLYIEHEGE